MVYLLFATRQPLIAVMEITAAVVREKFGAFTIDRLELTDPRPDEALVRIVASGMCQTDLHGRDGYYNTRPILPFTATKARAWCKPSATA